MSKITYENKVALNVNSDIADVNKCNATDLNEIKNVVNENDDNTTNNSNAIGTLSSLNTTNKNNLVSAINEVNQNDINKGTYSTEEQRVGTWMDGKPIYRKVIIDKTVPTGIDYFSTGINIDTFINCDGIVINNENKLTLPIVNLYSGNATTSCWGNGSQIYIYSNDSGLQGKPIYYILEYTKTTD